MTRDQIDVLWHKAMQIAVSKGDDFTRYEFAALVAQSEREACAKVCEEIQAEYLDDTESDDFAWDAAKRCEEAIRERAVDQPKDAP